MMMQQREQAVPGEESSRLESSPTKRSTSYNLLQSNKRKYARSDQLTRRSLPSTRQLYRHIRDNNNRFQTSRDRLSSKSSNTNSHSPFTNRPRPENRHRQYNLCSATFTTVKERRESA